jgi:hypothetical protein
MSTTTEHNAPGACDRLLDYVYDELGPEDKTVFEGHVATCAKCQAELATFRRVRSAVKTALPVVDPPANAQGAMHAQLMHAAAQRKPPEMGKLLAFGRKTRKVLLSPAFAMAAMFLVVGSVLAVRFSKGPLMEAKPAAPVEAPAPVVAEKAEAPAPSATPAAQPTTAADETLAHGESGKVARGPKEQKEIAPSFRARTKGASEVDAKLMLDAAKTEPESPARYAPPAKLEQAATRELKNNEENRRDLVQPPEGNMQIPAKKRLGGVESLDDGLAAKDRERTADKPAAETPVFGWGARQSVKSGEKSGVASAPSSTGRSSLGGSTGTRSGAGGGTKGGTWNAQPQQNMDSWDTRNAAPGGEAEMQVQSTTPRPAAAKPAPPPPPPAATAPAPVNDPKLQVVDGALARNKQTSSPASGQAQQAPAPQLGAYWNAAETQRKKAEDLAASGRCEDAIRIYAQLEKSYPGYKISPKDRRPYENCLKLTGRTQQVPESEGEQVKRREKAPARPSVDEEDRQAESVRKAPPAPRSPEPVTEPKPAPKQKKRAPSKSDDYANPYESPSQAAPADKPSL